MGFSKLLPLVDNSNRILFSTLQYRTATCLLFLFGIVQVRSHQVKMSLQSNSLPYARLKYYHLSSVTNSHKRSTQSQSFPGLLISPRSHISASNEIQKAVSSVPGKIKNSETEISSGRTLFGAAIFATLAPLIVTPLFQMMLPILPVLGLLSLPFLFMTALYMA